MADATDFLRTPVWYPTLASHTFLTSFVRLRSEAVTLLARKLSDKNVAAEISARVIEDLRLPLGAISGNAFVSVDKCAPTDTSRFDEKRGAVYSPESAWRFLCESDKVSAAAAAGEVEYVCIRPFRRMSLAREFRLFIKGKKLMAMSQYQLVRHFRRLDGIRGSLWEKARLFVKEVAWQIPLEDFVMDIYLTSDNAILIIDLNCWGEPTNPLLMQTWEQEWEEPLGLLLMPPPRVINGSVNVSF